MLITNCFTSDSLIIFCSLAISVTLWCKSWQAIFSSVRSNLKAGTRSTVNLTPPGPSTLRMTGAPPVDLVTLQFIKMISKAINIQGNLYSFPLTVTLLFILLFSALSTAVWRSLNIFDGDMMDSPCLSLVTSCLQAEDMLKSLVFKVAKFGFLQKFFLQTSNLVNQRQSSPIIITKVRDVVAWLWFLEDNVEIIFKISGLHF